MRINHPISFDGAAHRALRILLVGSGGNGSAVLFGLPYLHQALIAWGKTDGADVMVMDGDTVSPINCVRQPFGTADIGHNKATILVNRINLFHGFHWHAQGTYFSRNANNWVPAYEKTVDFVISCVDTRAARYEIHEAFQSRSGPWSRVRYWLDLGNNASNGQFVLGQPLNDINRQSRTRLRTVTELFPSIMDASKGEGSLPSCSAAEALERQEPFINNVLATSALAMLSRLLHYGTLDHHGAFMTGQSIQVWGAQMEFGSTAGPYVATGAVPVSAGTNLTNILPYSQQLNGPSWGIAAVNVAANTVTAPDNSVTGAELTAQQGVSGAYVTNDVPNPALYDGATVTGSVFLRAPGGSLAVGFYVAGENASGRTYLGYQTVQLTSTWQRFTYTGKVPNGLTRLFLQVGGDNTLNSGQVVDIWGSQMELSSTAGPYVATSALPVIAGKELVNMLPNAQVLSGPSWGLANGSMALNAAGAPDGTNTAATVTANPGSGDTYAINYVPNPSLYDGQTVTASVYLRVASGTLNTYLFLDNSGTGGLNIPNQPVTLTTSWQRFSITATLQNGLSELALQIGGAGSLTSGQSLQIWGSQMVIGTAAAPYTPPATGTTNVATGQPATLVQNGLNQTFNYDSFGNLQQNGSFNASYTAQNQMLGYAYDSAGNLLSNGITTMTWDAESKLTSAGGATYIYDAEGNRVETQGVGITDTIFFAGQPIARLSAGQWTDLIYGPNGLLAEVPGTEYGVPVYRLVDQLGSQVGTVSSNGLLTNPLDYTPFGQVFSGSTNDPYMYTGKERDTESGNDYFGARYYSSNMGRFSSPDPSGLYFADPTNPQSLNLYSYARNNPLKLIDPSGLTPCDYGSSDQGGEDYGDADNDGECTDTGGKPIDYSETVNVNANGSGDDTLSSVDGDVSTMIQYQTSVDAPSNGINKQHAACAADVAINYGLGFIPGYNAAKLVGTAAGLNFNFVQNAMSGKSIITAGPSPFGAAAALGSAYSLVSLQAFKNAGGTSLSALPAAGAITDLGKIASTAGTIANVLNTVSAGYDLYQCYQKP